MENLAPPVVAVVVTCDPGPWFEETLRSLAAQDYPELSVLILDAASVVDPTPTVAAILPSAFVRRLPENLGFAASVDAVLGMVAGASHLLLCHDDVALDPDVVQVMMEESFRSNAGIVAPKLVSWDDPHRLLHVGMAVDKGGAVVDRVEPGEIDHGQHDAVQDVFLAPGGCTLVRADLFAELGGLDPAVVALGDDLDLCWRAQVAGARVVVAPSARVRHLERLAAGERPLPLGAPSLQALQRRHELRIVLIAYSRFHLLRVLPQLVALTIGEMTVALLTGHRRRAAALWHAWRWNWAARKDLRAARAALAQRRRLSDVQVRRLQLHGSARLTAYFRRLFTHGLEAAHAGAAALQPPPPPAQKHHTPSEYGVPYEGEADLGQASPLYQGAAGDGRPASGDGAGSVAPHGDGTGPSPAVVPSSRSGPGISGRFVTWAVVVFVLLVGSRQLLGLGFPWMAGLLRLPDWSTLLHRFWVGWQGPGLSNADPTTPATAPLGVAALILFGSSALLQKILVLGCLPFGAWGMSRLVRPFGSIRARVAAVVAYVSLPLAYDALATGRWDALLAYGFAPWIVLRLARASGLEPFTAGNGERPTAGRRRRIARQVLVLGVIEAVLCSLAPAGAALTLLVAAGLSVGGLAVLGRRGVVAASRMIGVAAGATAVSVVALAPWSLALLAGPQRWEAVTGLPLGPGSGPGWTSLLRLAIGPIGDTPLVYGLVAAAVLPLLLAARHRLTWAAMAWGMVGSSWVLIWAEGRGWTGAFAVDAQMLLAPAAVGVAACIGLGVVAFVHDLPSYRFGWRQAAAVLAAGMAAVGTLPVLAAAGGGRWELPATGFGEATAWLSARAPAGHFRVLWLADPRDLPGGGWRLQSGVAYAVSDGGIPDLTGLWAGSDPGASSALGRAVRLAEDHGTIDLGQQLAAAHVRYVVVVQALAPEIPGYQTPATFPVPAQLTDALNAQSDLIQVPGQGGLSVYVDAVTTSGRALVHRGSSSAYRAGQYAELVVWALSAVAALRGLGRSSRRRRVQVRARPGPYPPRGVFAHGQSPSPAHSGQPSEPGVPAGAGGR